MRHSTFYLLPSIFFFLLVSCRQDVIIFPPEQEQHGDSTHIEVVDTMQTDTGVVVMPRVLAGFYLLNEGNMGSNKASLDYYDFASATYTRDIYSASNPTVTQSLGDVGNDLRVYGSRLYAVINCSGLIEVMSADSARHIGTIHVPNCRYLRFSGAYGYVTSYAGPVSLDASHAQLGYVARFDTATLAILDTCLVGYQPDELEIVGSRLYVANSGGYLMPNYETTVSVIDLTTFREIQRIEVAPNLHRLRADAHGGLWVTSRGDYYGTPSRLYYVDTETNTLTDSVPVAVSNLCIAGDSLYLIGSEFSYETFDNIITYGIVDTRSHKLVTSHFITDGTESDIRVPYGIAVNPVTRDIYLTDARNYVTPGYLHCYSPAGLHRWSVRTGDIPAHMAFLFR